MGASASKAARTAASTASRRQYPSQPSSSTTTSPTRQQPAVPKSDPQPQGPVYHAQERASETRSEAIDLDARDPHFDASLRSIGPVIPTPTLSRSSTFNQAQPPGTSAPSQSVPADTVNPALMILSSRTRISSEAAEDFDALGRRGYAGRRYVDVVSLKQILTMRDEHHVSDDQIEMQFGLKKGGLATLGPKGVVVGIR